MGFSRSLFPEFACGAQCRAAAALLLPREREGRGCGCREPRERSGARMLRRSRPSPVSSPPARGRRRGRPPPFLRPRGPGTERFSRARRPAPLCGFSTAPLDSARRAAAARRSGPRARKGAQGGSPRGQEPPSLGQARPPEWGPGSGRMFLKLAVVVQVLSLLVSGGHGFPKPVGKGKRLRYHIFCIFSEMGKVLQGIDRGK